MSDVILRRIEDGWAAFRRDITSHIPHHGYHDHQDRPEGDTMSLASIEADITQGIHDGMDKAADLYNHFKTLAESKLPEFADLAQAAASNPLVDAALSAVHLSPAMLTALAGVVAKADADIAALTPESPAEVPEGDGQAEVTAGGPQAATEAPEPATATA